MLIITAIIRLSIRIVVGERSRIMAVMISMTLPVDMKVQVTQSQVMAVKFGMANNGFQLVAATMTMGLQVGARRMAFRARAVRAAITTVATPRKTIMGGQVALGRLTATRRTIVPLMLTPVRMARAKLAQARTALEAKMEGLRHTA